MKAPFKRVFLIVLDSMGIGREPDAEEFGDGDCNTLATIVKSPKFFAPNLAKLGLFNIDGVGCGRPEASPIGAFARLRELSRGKDTTTGHWEIAGIVSTHPMPTYPDGFPQDVIERLEAVFGKKILCNKPYAGTRVIHDYGREQKETGGLIVYTSADSVLQIAAHESDVPVERLYDYCRMARKIMQGEHGVGRIIARPYIGTYPNYERTSRRHDFSLEPTGTTMLDQLKDHGFDVLSIGKIYDIFAHRGTTDHVFTSGNPEGIEKTIEATHKDFHGLCFTNLVDTDMIYGHRNDVDGYAKALSYFDEKLPEIMAGLGEDDLLMITADHGCDPVTPSTDHSREYVPWLICGPRVKAGANLHTLPTFADLAETVLEYLGAPQLGVGTSHVSEILKED